MKIIKHKHETHLAYHSNHKCDHAANNDHALVNQWLAQLVRKEVNFLSVNQRVDESSFELCSREYLTNSKYSTNSSGSNSSIHINH
jgi:hypothetical protein